MTKRKTPRPTQPYLRDAAATLGLDFASESVIEYLREVDVADSADEMTLAIEGLAFEVAKAACETAADARQMTAAEVHAHVGRYQGGFAGDMSDAKEQAARKRDALIAKLHESGLSVEAIGQRHGIALTADGVRKALKRHQNHQREAEQDNLQGNLLVRLKDPPE